MTRYEGRIYSEAPAVQSGCSACALPVERKHVFVSSVLCRATETLLAQERTIRIGPVPLTPAAATGTHPLGSDEGRHQ